MTTTLADLKGTRLLLKKSQSEMAELLGVSVRAVQSYEQGWRKTPLKIQQISALLLYLNWRKHGGRPRVCWRVRKCSPAQRATCSAFQYKAGDLCWLLTGSSCSEDAPKTAETKLAQCAQCDVVRPWWPASAR